MLSLTNAILYPVTNKIDDLSTLAFGFLGVGIPLALGQLFFIGGLLLSKNTGIITMIMFITVGLSYFFSIFRYNESQNVFCTFGVVLIIGGLWKVLFSKNI